MATGDAGHRPQGAAASRCAVAVHRRRRVAADRVRHQHLARADGTGGWFRHFMHYYRLPQIIQMMTDASLRPVATYGARDGRVTGTSFDEDEPEAMVIIAVPERVDMPS